MENAPSTSIPWGTDESAPPADLILLTQHTHDDFQPDEIERLRTGGTKIAAPHDVAGMLTGDVTPVAPDEAHEIAGVRFTTVPAYNTREEALDSHPRANRWVGYVIELGGATYYHAGDTDHAPELDDVKTDVAFVPVGGYYTMNVPEAAGLVPAMRPGLAVPMHFGFVVGSASDGDAFRAAADAVPCGVIDPDEPLRAGVARGSISPTPDERETPS